MKEATGEVSMTVVTVVILAVLVGLATWLFSDNGPAREWFNSFFDTNVNNPDLNPDD